MSAFQEQDYNKKFDLNLWKRLFKFVKPYKKEMSILAMFMIGVALIDAILPLMTKYAIDNFVIPKDYSGIVPFSIIYFIIVVFQVINIYVFISKAGKIQSSLRYDITKAGFKKLQELSFSYYDRTPIGWLMARLTSDVRKLGDIIAWGLVDLVWGMAMMSFFMVVMIGIDWKLGLMTLSVIPPLAIISFFFQKKILKSYRNVRKINSKITGAFNEGIMGARTTKTLVREKQNLKEFKMVTKDMKHSSVRAAVFSSLYLPVVVILASVGTSIALWSGGERVMILSISYGTLVAFIAYTTRFFDPISELARIFAELQSAQASAERVLSLIDTECDIIDSEDVIKEYGSTFNPIRENWSDMKGNIEFKNVTFEYKNGEKVLENFNLNIKAGQTIALVGETGSGKSTIVNLACRFYEPTEGEILIDGVNYKERSLLWLHDNLGYVLQTPHLFSGTIKDNIRYGRLDSSELDIIRAAKLVNAHNFIKNLENGYDTEVGEGGNRLSTGQKQLISFARAILKNPKIFVLDEATSSIDTETEKIIQDAINKVLEGRTSFIIAHRLSTIRGADRILVIKDGKVIEQGNHKELVKLKKYYYKLYTNQFKEEKESILLDNR